MIAQLQNPGSEVSPSQIKNDFQSAVTGLIDSKAKYTDLTLVYIWLAIISLLIVITMMLVIISIKRSKKSEATPVEAKPEEKIIISLQKPEKEETPAEEEQSDEEVPPAVEEEPTEEVSEEEVSPVEEESAEEDDSEDDEADGDEESPFANIEGKPYKPFVNRILDASEQTQEFYNIIKNELLSYKKVKARISKKCESFRNGRVLKAKLSMAGQTLKLFLALDPNEFDKNTYHHKDMGHKKSYQEVPLLIRLKSRRSVKRAIELIKIMMEKSGLVNNPKYEEKDYIKELLGLVEVLENLEEKQEEVKVVEELLPTDEEESDYEVDEEDEESDSPFAGIEAKPYKPFVNRIVDASEQTQEFYNEIKNELLGYKKIKARISKKCESFRFGRALKVKLSMAGQTLKLFLALDPNEFDRGTYFHKDMSHKKTYQEVPLLIRLKSRRSVKRAKELIKVMMEKSNIVNNPKYEMKDYRNDMLELVKSYQENEVSTVEQ